MELYCKRCNRFTSKRDLTRSILGCRTCSVLVTPGALANNDDLPALEAFDVGSGGYREAAAVVRGVRLHWQIPAMTVFPVVLVSIVFGVACYLTAQFMPRDIWRVIVVGLLGFLSVVSMAASINTLRGRYALTLGRETVSLTNRNVPVWSVPRSEVSGVRVTLAPPVRPTERAHTPWTLDLTTHAGTLLPLPGPTDGASIVHFARMVEAQLFPDRATRESGNKNKAHEVPTRTASPTHAAVEEVIADEVLASHSEDERTKES